MKTTELTVQLPEDDTLVLASYAKEHALSMDEFLARIAWRLRAAPHAPHPTNLKFTGTVPAHIDAQEAHREHLVRRAHFGVW